MPKSTKVSVLQNKKAGDSSFVPQPDLEFKEDMKQASIWVEGRKENKRRTRRLMGDIGRIMQSRVR